MSETKTNYEDLVRDRASLINLIQGKYELISELSSEIELLNKKLTEVNNSICSIAGHDYSAWKCEYEPRLEISYRYVRTCKCCGHTVINYIKPKDYVDEEIKLTKKIGF